MTEDLDVFLADFGVPVVLGAVTGTGILDMPDEVLGNGSLISTEYALTVRTSVFSAAQMDDAITVDGVAYQIRTVQKSSDGKFSTFTLSLI